MVVWLASVCAYSILAAPASARRTKAPRLVRTALGAKMHRPERALPMATDAVPSTAMSTKPGGPKKSESKREKKEKKKKRKKKPRVAPGHALPLPVRVASVSELDDRHHDYPALDIEVRTGIKVRAVTPGWVKDTTGRGACGKGVIIKGKDGFTYTYCHGNKRFVSPGKRVDAGDPIMASGNTGNSSGPHLHLQITKPNGRLVCPQDLLPTWVKGKNKSPWKADARGCHTGNYGRKNRGRRR
jgi:murein DD-endopeptidase MepM/ murein hydrolase activator NlpD